MLECFLSISLRCQILHGPRFKLAYTQCHCFAILADCANLIISCYCITAVLGYQYYMKDYMCLLCNSVPPTRSYLAARNEGCTHLLWEKESAEFYHHDYRIIYFDSWWGCHGSTTKHLLSLNARHFCLLISRRSNEGRASQTQWWPPCTFVDDWGSTSYKVLVYVSRRVLTFQN